MKRILYCLLFVVLAFSCKEKYYPDPIPGNNNNLVVEGFINGGGGASIFHLSRTVNLVDTVLLKKEMGARLFIEGDDQSSYPLYAIAEGEYASSSLSLNPAVQYRLRIETSNGKIYQSDYTPVKQTVPIDSISWRRENGGVQFYIHAHDDQNNTRYYRWEYDETWEIHSTFFTSLKYKMDPTGLITGLEYRDTVSKAPDFRLYYCWRNAPSTNIFIGSTAQLSNDRVYLPLHYIPEASEKISVLYSVLVKQYAITAEAYAFWQRMKKNTESVGTIFDAQPSNLISNIHCISNPEEPVVGYVSAGTVKEQRIFVYNYQLPNWGYHLICAAIDIPNNLDTLRSFGNYMPMTPTEVAANEAVVRLNVADPICVDCTLRGSSDKPSFWP
jgi:hypothetical protein